jgi:hypothetical protein
MRNGLLVALCAVSLMAWGCDNAKVKTEAEKAGEHLKEAGQETVEAGKALGRAAEAAGQEAADKIEAEKEHLENKTGETPQGTPADTK